MAFDKKQLAREIERDRRAQVAERLSKLRALLQAAQRERRETIERIRLRCRAARLKLRTNCEARKQRAHADGEIAIHSRKREMREERHLDKLQRSSLRGFSGVARRAPVVRGEREAESDDEVRRNLPPELVTVFNRVRRTIKGSPRKSRSEAFLDWAEENPDEIYALQEQSAEREVKRLVKEYEREAAKHSRGRVPF